MVDLATLAHRLVEAGKRVIAPVTLDGVTLFRELVPGAEPDFDTWMTRNSAKEAVFPRSEVILAYEKDAREMRLSEPERTAQPTVVIGAHPCDAAAMCITDPLFAWDDDDLFYQEKRQATTVISLACTDCDDACFCLSVGLAPDATEGSDILLTKTSDEEYLVEVLSEKGETVVSAFSDLFRQGGGDKSLATQKAYARQEERVDMTRVKATLDRESDLCSLDDAGLRCLGCAICAYTCPTCHCFDIQDEAGRTRGERRRNWDACTLALYSLHGDGHNPRPRQADRYSNRVRHKFQYYPALFGRILCTGCGRCSRNCPVGINMAEVLHELAVAASSEKKA